MEVTYTGRLKNGLRIWAQHLKSDAWTIYQHPVDDVKKINVCDTEFG